MGFVGARGARWVAARSGISLIAVAALGVPATLALRHGAAPKPRTDAGLSSIDPDASVDPSIIDSTSPSATPSPSPSSPPSQEPVVPSVTLSLVSLPVQGQPATLRLHVRGPHTWTGYVVSFNMTMQEKSAAY
jgi:hypothetical protein